MVAVSESAVRVAERVGTGATARVGTASPLGAAIAGGRRLPDPATVARTMEALRGRNVNPRLVQTKEEALAAVLQLLPKGARVASGGSTTLAQIGLIDILGGPDSDYRYLNKEWLAENDMATRNRVRAVASAGADFYLGSVQAIIETGEVIGADGGGSRQGPYVFGPAHVIWVASINKIVPTLEDGIRRVREVAFPLEDQRMKAAGFPGSQVGKIVIYERERPGRFELVLVEEPLGF